MPQQNEHEWERRPAPGSAPARTEDFAPALRSFERHKREHEARQRRRGRLTLSEAQIRGRASMGLR